MISLQAVDYYSCCMQVMTAGQRVSFEFQRNNYIFTVNQVAVAGQEKSSTIERGMISSDTYIVFETSNASGIKVYFYIWLCTSLYAPTYFVLVLNFFLLVNTHALVGLELITLPFTLFLLGGDAIWASAHWLLSPLIPLSYPILVRFNHIVLVISLLS